MAYLSSLSTIFVATVLSLCFSPSLSFTSFVFGDSLVDAGNNDYLFTLSRADTPPYGIDFAASGGQPTGRFTNGRTIADIVGEALGGKSFPPPYLAPNTGDNDTIFSGINYASGASGILDETGSLFIGRVPLRKQIDYFKETRFYMIKVVGSDRTKQIVEGALFSITVGSNDILNYIQPQLPFFKRSKLSPSSLQDIMVSNLTVQLQRLYELGARKFTVVGVGPLGCIPFVRTFTLQPRGSCSFTVNRVIEGYNSKLINTLGQLNQQMGPDATFVYANSYSVFLDIIEHYQQYGFENTEDACCGGNFPPLMCFQGRKVNISSKLCGDRSKYVFWDAYHPTEAVNVIVADKLLNGNQSVSFPINIRELYNLKL